MKIKGFLSIALVAAIALTACNKDEITQEMDLQKDDLVIADSKVSPIIEGQFVVVFNEGSFKMESDLSYESKLSEVRKLAQSMFTKSANVEIDKTYAEALQGFSVKMTADDVARLEKDSRVKYILPDRMYIMKKPVPPEDPTDPPADPTQEVPYGIARVGYGSGIGKTAWILDTGIDYDHPDLNVDVSRAVTFVRSKSADDDNGHGTHCAGTVAAKDNDLGVVGVAAGATLVPVKVLDRRGSGAFSGIISGIDYVAANASSGDAANMSLGGGVYQAIDDAVYAASQKGIYFALAAGNESSDANYSSPARVNGPNIFTISAMDINDNWAYFSNYGNPPVDYCEPGYNIYSTAKGGGYTTMSGTSMAAPHMCGILLMTNGNPRTDGYVNGDPDGNADPIGTI